MSITRGTVLSWRKARIVLGHFYSRKSKVILFLIIYVIHTLNQISGLPRAFAAGEGAISSALFSTQCVLYVYI